MSLSAFEGGAGSGKTHSVMERLATALSERPLSGHERVLALTFMHGARHRLDEQLEKIALLRGRYDAMTLDSFALTICRRWRSRLRELGLELPNLDVDEAFEAVCALAAGLLAEETVRKWVASSYPYVLVDEAQDLNGPRLKLVELMVAECQVLLAFDEFQCLDRANRPVAITAWVEGRCIPTTLTGCRRTSETALLKAAAEIREGKPITASGPSFQVKVAPMQKGVPALPAALTAYVMNNPGSVAVLSPARPTSSSYVRETIELVRNRKWGQGQNVGPFNVRWEGVEEARVKALREALSTVPARTFEDVSGILKSSGVPAAAHVAQHLRRLRAGRGTTEFESSFVEEVLNRQLTVAGQFARRPMGRLRAMTVHQAKNREFERVVVLWPFRVPADADDRRRLLYNAVTRAKKSCLVLVQSPDMLKEAPFA